MMKRSPGLFVYYVSHTSASGSKQSMCSTLPTVYRGGEALHIVDRLELQEFSPFRLFCVWVPSRTPLFVANDNKAYKYT